MKIPDFQPIPSSSLFSLKFKNDDDTYYAAALFFSSCGKYLATQGEASDHTLTVWDWRLGRVLASNSAPANHHYQVLIIGGGGKLGIFTLNGCNSKFEVADFLGSIH